MPEYSDEQLVEEFAFHLKERVSVESRLSFIDDNGDRLLALLRKGLAATPQKEEQESNDWTPPWYRR